MKTKQNETLIDVRPVFARGETPCAIIDEAADTTPPGGSFVLLAPFEPMPLYTKLGRQGFTHQATPLDDGGYRVVFKKAK
jgi:hypothetical protein